MQRWPCLVFIHFHSCFPSLYDQVGGFKPSKSSSLIWIIYPGRKENHVLAMDLWCLCDVICLLFDFHIFLQPSKIEHGSTVTRLHGVVPLLCWLTRQSTNLYMLRLYHEGSMQPKWLIELTKRCRHLMTLAKIQSKDQSQASKMDLQRLKILTSWTYSNHLNLINMFKATAPLSSSKMHVPCFFSTLLPQRAEWIRVTHGPAESLKSSGVSAWPSWPVSPG